MNVKPELEFFGFFNIRSIILVAIIFLTVSGLAVVAPYLAYAQKKSLLLGGSIDDDG